MSRRTLLALAFIFALLAILIGTSGGGVATIAGWRLSARSPWPSSMTALGALAAWLVVARRTRAVASDLDLAWAWIDAHAPALVVVIAAAAVALAIVFGTFSATSSDASGYLSEAAMLWARQLSHREPLAAIADWPGGAATLAPYGWHAAATGEQVPTYAPGLPLLMAWPQALGGTIAACLVGVGAAGLAVWASARVAMQFAAPAAGVLAATALVASPTFLVQSFQPMSDVPVTAVWLVCWLCLTSARTSRRLQARIGLAGLSAALAVLIRPNLAPLAAIPLAYVATWPAVSRRWRIAGALAFACPVAVAGAVVAVLQWRWYGSPLMSGYGGAGDLYAWSHVAPNATRYLGWLVSFESPLLLLAPLAVWRPGVRAVRWMLAFAALVALAYALYLVVEQWTYVRFLLPAMAIALAASSACVMSVVSRWAPRARVPLAAVLVLAVVAHGVSEARALGVFGFRSVHARAMLAGRYLEPVLPVRAVVIAGEHSGSVRYYTWRSIVRWELLPNGTLGAAIARLEDAGYDVWIALDAWEEELFRERFRDHPAAGLDWPPVVDGGTEMRTRAWRIADRARFLAGDRLHTDRLR